MALTILAKWQKLLSDHGYSFEQWRSLDIEQQSTLINAFEQQPHQFEKIADIFPTIDNNNPLSPRKIRRDNIRFFIIYIIEYIYFIQEQLLISKNLLAESLRHRPKHKHETALFNFYDEDRHENDFVKAGLSIIPEIKLVMNVLVDQLHHTKQAIKELEDEENELILHRRHIKKRYFTLYEEIMMQLLTEAKFAISNNAAISESAQLFYKVAKLTPHTSNTILFAGILRDKLNLAVEFSLDIAEKFHTVSQAKLSGLLNERHQLADTLSQVRQSLQTARQQEHALLERITALRDTADSFSGPIPELHDYLARIVNKTNEALHTLDQRHPDAKEEDAPTALALQTPFTMKPDMLSGKKHDRDDDDHDTTPKPTKRTK